MEFRRVVRVFLATPGDLVPERRAAKAVCDELNSLIGGHLGYQIDLVGWEDTTTGLGRPQEIINRDLVQCQLLIGAVWKKWGTPPAKVGPYLSGFEEEFCITQERHREGEDVEILLFFKKVPADLTADPGEQLQRVLTFKAKIQEERTLLYEEFENEAEFSERLRRGLTRYLLRLSEAEKAAEKAEKSTDPRSDFELSAPSEPYTSALSTPSLTFLKSVTHAAMSDSSAELLTALGVARLRALAYYFSGSRNSDTHLDVHDANLFFFSRTTQFGEEETDALVSSALIFHKDQIVPFWYWYTSIYGRDLSHLGNRILISLDDKSSIGALTLLTNLRATFTGEHGHLHKTLQSACLKSTAPDERRKTYMAYLAEVGIEADLEAVETEISRTNSKTQDTAIDAGARILARADVSRALEWLIQKDPVKLSEAIVGLIFSKPRSISEDLLQRGLRAKAAELRLACLKALADRRRLTDTLLEALLDDSDRDIQLLALQQLAIAGREFSDEDARRILVRKLATLGFFQTGKDEAGERKLEEFKKWKIRQLPKTELKSLAEEQSKKLDIDATLAIVDKYFSEHSDHLRSYLEDQFESAFEAFLEHLATISSDQALIERWKGLREFQRRTLTSDALEILCKHATCEDIELVCRSISEIETFYSETVLEYLGRCASRDNIGVLIEFAERAPRAGHSTGIFDLYIGPSKSVALGRALYNIGGANLIRSEEISGAPDRAKAVLVCMATKSEFSTFDDEFLLSQIGNDSEICRKAFLTQIVRFSSKSKMRTILNDYIMQNQHIYYNCLYWLDVGISAPNTHARALARQEQIAILN